MNVICISGKAQHGKDTTAVIAKKILEENGKRVLITHYADLLKFLCKEYFGWNGIKDEAGRETLQRVGTDIVRNRAPDFWVEFVVKFLSVFEDEWDFVLIPDTRFPNEVDMMREMFGATHLRVLRPDYVSPLTVEQQNHPSETALDDYIPDYYLTNRGNLAELATSIETWLRDLL